jgi:hypothetical protein
LNFSETISSDNINAMNWDFLFFLVYGKNQAIRQQDLDHIQPKSRLAGIFGWEKIGHVANFALMFSKVNRGIKNDLPLDEWIRSLSISGEYLHSHLIPDDPELWKVGNFEAFLKARAQLLTQKAAEHIPPKSDDVPPIAPPPPTAVPPQNESTRERLDRNWNHKMTLLAQYRFKEAFDLLHASLVKAGLWVTSRERGLLYHHNYSGSKILMTIYVHEHGLWIKYKFAHFPVYYENNAEELEQIVGSGWKFYAIQDIPAFTEKIAQLRSKHS